ncbi:MAG: hypothetical protein JST14_15840 [Bacteroidetes bacterium]|nr:hypothetical protein [Bacteroidota bacterium]
MRSNHFVRPAFVIILLVIASRVEAQRCGVVMDEPAAKRIADIVRSYRNIKTYSTEPTAEIKIPVVFHIILNSSLQASFNSARINTQLAILNEDFQRMNADSAQTFALYKRIASGLKVKFVMASVDPTGNPTDAIMRWAVNQDFRIVADTAVYRSMSWPSDRYLNIWVIASSDKDYLGYSTFPGETGDQGVTINYRYFWPGMGQFQKGRTLTHEVGHFMGLFHIWGDKDDCSGTDLIDDTPPQAGPDYTPPPVRPLSCDPTRFRMWENYMDYTDDAYMNMFTVGQVNAMTAILHTVRTGLINNAATILPPELETIQQVQVYCEAHAIVVEVPTLYSNRSVVVYSLMGQVLYQGEGSTRIDLTGHASGIYLVVAGDIRRKVFVP